MIASGTSVRAGAPNGGQLRRTLLVRLCVLFAGLVLLQPYVDRMYRAAGRLGETVPEMQFEITGGTAHAPFIYRQGVPRIRLALMNLFKPGHAAVLVDMLFGSVAIWYAMLIGAVLSGSGGEETVDMALVAVLACSGAIHYHKPEAVASISVTLLSAYLLLSQMLVPFAIATAFSSLIRPEFPILWGLSLVVASASCGRPHADQKGFGRAGMASLLCGITYLGCAKLVFWPHADYPAGTPPVMLAANIDNPLRWPGLLFALALMGYSLRIAWLVQGNKCTISCNKVGVLGALVFQVTYLLSVIVMGKTDETRLYMPVLPLVYACWRYRLHARDANLQPACARRRGLDFEPPA